MPRLQPVRSIGLAAGLLAPAVTASMLLAGQHGMVTSSREQGNGTPPTSQALNSSLSVSGPNFCGGEATTLDRLPALAGYRVYFPNSVMANGSNLHRAWWCPNVQTVALEFSSGVTVQMHPSDLVDPAGLWSHWATHEYSGT